MNAVEGAAYGAAILAAVGVGEYKNVSEVSKLWIQKTETILPGNDMEAYKERYPIYESLYPSLKENFETIAQVES